MYMYIESNHSTLILKIFSSMISPSKLLETAKQLMPNQCSSEEKILEGDNFQDYSGKDQCIYNI